MYYHYLVANKELFTLLAGDRFIAALRNYMERVFVDGVFTPIVNKMGYRTKYEVSAFIGMVFNVTVDWIRGGMKEPLDDMIEESTKLITSFDFGYDN